MSGCADDGNALQMQAISTARYGQIYPQRYPQARKRRSLRTLQHHRKGLSPSGNSNERLTA